MNSEENGDKIFVKITNNDIYKEIQELKELVEKQNKTIAWHTKVIGILTTLLLITLSVVITHISG